MIVLDTTVLSYAVGVEHPLREPCRRLLHAHGEGRIEVTTTIEVIQEFAHVSARRRPRLADGAFGKVPRLPWIDPGTAALDGLLGR